MNKKRIELLLLVATFSGAATLFLLIKIPCNSDELQKMHKNLAIKMTNRYAKWYKKCISIRGVL